MLKATQERSAWRIYFTRPLLVIGAMGFYSGLPLALSASTLTAWLSDSRIDRTTIGLFAAVATPYALKFLWAPAVDGLRLPLLGKLGRRRSWLLLTQALLAIAIGFMGFCDPAGHVNMTALMALLVSALSATQDIVIDAYRVERLAKEEQGEGAAMSTLGYRIGMLVSGAGALALAQALGWQQTYLFMAALAATSVPLTLLAREPGIKAPIPAKGPLGERVTSFFRDSVIAPFADFITRPHWLAVLAFVVLYKLGDAFMGTLFNPFLLAIGFTKMEIAEIVKIYGLGATLLGSFVGGAMVMRWGTFRTLFFCGLAHMVTNLLLIEQARLGNDPHFLILSIVLQNLSGGMSLAAFVAYLSALTKAHYTATQYALLSALAALGRTLMSTPSGWVAQQFGWQAFFLFSSLLALPGLWLVIYLQRRTK